MSNGSLPEGLLSDRSLLVVEDDTTFSRQLVRGLEARGFNARSAATVGQAMTLICRFAPAFAVIDVRLGKESGLDVVAELSRLRQDARIVVLSGYDSFTGAALAIRLGAIDYLAKPVDVGDVVKALSGARNSCRPPSFKLLTPARVRWERILRVYELCNHNISETARRLAMHRRTLQRILSKRSPK